MDLIESIDSNLALEDLLLDTLDFLAEVVIVRDKEKFTATDHCLSTNREMDWTAWWQTVEDLPRFESANSLGL